MFNDLISSDQWRKPVLELEFLLSYRQAVINQQLAKLRLEGFVDFRRQGKTRYYRINELKILKLINFLLKEFY